MNKNELITGITSDSDEKNLLSYINDKMLQCENKNIITTTMFLNEREQYISEMFIRHYSCRFSFYGGYENSVRKVIAFLPDYFSDENLTGDDCGISFVRLYVNKFDVKNANLSHRDYLGALMNLGIQRNVIGDIIILEDGAEIILLSKITSLILTEMKKVGRFNVTAAKITSEELITFPPEIETITDTVSSLRLDSVVSSGFKISRSKAADAVRSGLVMKNSSMSLKPDSVVYDGDVISMRGKGKMVMKRSDGVSKKGRIRIIIEKYI